MLTYYPAIKPYITHRIKVESPHEIYVEECGNPDGIPILYVHGGPGFGCTADSRRFFDPNIYRIILFDQRGAGLSTPHADLTHNNTQALVQDMETIREQLGVSRWMLFGGSWGSTLSLVYAQTHPTKVTGMILRGIFLNRNQDIEWFYDGKGANYIFPDFWQDFVAPLPENQRHNLIYTYYEILTGKDEIARMTAAKAWATWEARLVALDSHKQLLDYMTNPHNCLSLARLECHYFVNNCFLEPDQILRNAPSIAHIPTIIIHGRYDMVCTLDNAWLLHRALPNSKLEIIRNAGHTSLELGILDALIHATQKMAKII